MRQKASTYRFGDSLSKLDIFGHQIGVTYKGEHSYKTNLGAAFTIIMALGTLVYAVLQCQEFILV